MTRKTKLEGEIAAIGDLSREELVKRWIKAHGSPPPKGLKRGLLERSAAWHLQSKRLGGLRSDVRRTLTRLMVGSNPAEATPSSNQKLSSQALRAIPDTGSQGLEDARDAAEQFPDLTLSPGIGDPSSGSARPVRPAQSSTDAVSHVSASPPLRARPAAGTRLVREWNGRTHVVEVTQDGFVMDGKNYRSLSAIAKRITGAHWSGPRFFGL